MTYYKIKLKDDVLYWEMILEEVNVTPLTVARQVVVHFLVTLSIVKVTSLAVDLVTTLFLLVVPSVAVTSSLVSNVPV